MQYELINPSDQYTFEAESHEIAALATLLVGGGKYSAAPEDSAAPSVPLFLFGGAVEWYEESFLRSIEEGLEALRPGVASALKSFMLGGFKDRRRYNAALSAITDEEKRREFIGEWQDGCSSMNDIGTYAHQLGERISSGSTKEGKA